MIARDRESHRGTTLIELMVVMSVIATLTGVLLPALAGGREAARGIACASNLRELQAGNSDYATDHDGRYIAGAKDMQMKNLHRWHGERSSRGEAFDSSRGELAAYLGDGRMSMQMRECPTFVQTLEMLADSGAGFERGNGGYGYNRAFVGADRVATSSGMWEIRSDLVGSKSVRFADPTRTIGFTDAAFTGRRGLIEYSFAEPRFWPEWGTWRPDASVHFRHGGSTNAAWLDGHVSSPGRTHTEPGWASKQDAGRLGLGWFGVLDDNSLYDYE